MRTTFHTAGKRGDDENGGKGEGEKILEKTIHLTPKGGGGGVRSRTAERVHGLGDLNGRWGAMVPGGKGADQGRRARKRTCSTSG